MGVFTTGRQVFQEIDMPGWWLSGAAVDLDFINGRYYDSSTAIPRTVNNFLTTSRASIAYAKTQGGLLTQFASGVPRITDLGLLIEDARTNLCISSGDSRSAGEGNSVSGWNTQATTATQSGTAPDGSSLSTLITATAGTGDHERYLGVSVTAAIHTASMFLKAGTTSWAQLQLDGNQSNHSAFFNISAGTVGTVGTNSRASIEPYGNGWYRCILSSTNNLIAGNAPFTVMPATSDNQAFNWNAAGTETIYVWGTQFEQATFMSSYIPTTTTSATRAADAITTAGTLASTIAGANASLVLNIEIDEDSNGDTGDGFASFIFSSSTFATARHNLSFGGSKVAATLLDGANSAVLQANSNLTMAYGLKLKSGWAWDGSGRSAVSNGGTIVSDAAAPQNFGAAQQFYSGGGGQPRLFGYVRRFTAWSTRLADATLQALTV